MDDKHTNKRTETHACDLIERQAAIEKLISNLTYMHTFGADRSIDLIEELPSAQPDVPDINVGDMISRQAALKGLEDLNIASFYEDNEHSKEAYHEIKQMLETLPPVDAVPIVWCGECKYMMPDGHCTMFADYRIRPSSSDFCSAGERKDGDHND